MSVLMTMRIAGDPAKLEQSDEGSDNGQVIIASAKQHGVIAHRFYGSDDGQIMVLDLWPDRESFQAFMEENNARIRPMMEAVGAHGEPEITFWRELDTSDKVGWGA